MESVRRHVLISGRVQGVWFRQRCAETARAAGVSGWVRNLPDGRVEAVFEGAPDAVASLLAWCRTGPPRARVDAVAVTVQEPAGHVAFEVRA